MGSDDRLFATDVCANFVAFENGRISNFEGIVTSTLDQVILHTVVHHSSTSTVPTCQISLKSKKLFVDGRTYVQTDGHMSPALLGRLCQRIDLKMLHNIHPR